MKKLIAALLALLGLLWIATSALGQQVNSSQIKLKANGGLTGDTASALAVGVYRGTSAPASPVTGQLWADTNYSPPVLKTFNGATWDAPTNATAIPTLTDFSSLPGSPVDGQVAWVKAPGVWIVYDGTAGAWKRTDTGSNASANVGLPGSSVITPPSAAPTAANTTGGSMTAGTHSCKYTYVNSTGGETTPSPASNVVTVAASGKINLTGVTTGGTGTVARRIYCTVAGNGGLYMNALAQVSDNVTTTASVTVADASLTHPAPERNYSGALPAGWAVTNNTAVTDRGGAGSTGGSLIVYSAGGTSSTNGLTSEACNSLQFDMSSYQAGNYTITYRLVKNAAIYSTDVGQWQPLVGLRASTANNAIFYWVGMGNTLPFTVANVLWPRAVSRTTIGAASSNVTNGLQFFPNITSWPVWVRIVKRGIGIGIFFSGDGRTWGQFSGTAGSATANASIQWNHTTAQMNLLEMPMMRLDWSTASTATSMYAEIDSFTLTVD